MDTLHTIRHDIHSSQTLEVFTSGNFVSGILDFFPLYPTGTPQNYHMYIYAMQEYNRKLDGFGGQVIEPVDAGFRPINFGSFFGGVPSPGINDFLLIEAGGFLLQQDSFKLVLEQDD